MYDLHVYKILFKKTRRGKKTYFLKLAIIENIPERMVTEREMFYKKCYGYDTVINFIKHGREDWIIDKKKVIFNAKEINY